MNTSLRFTLIMIVSLLLPAAVRLDAQDTARGPGAEKLERLLKQSLESDANKDGKLTVEEAKAFLKNRPAKGDAPKRAGGGERLAPTHADVAYGENPKQVFDIWLAKSEARTPLDCLLNVGYLRLGMILISRRIQQNFPGGDALTQSRLRLGKLYTHTSGCPPFCSLRPVKLN